MKGTTTVPPAVSPEEAPSPAAKLVIVHETDEVPSPSLAAELTITREPLWRCRSGGSSVASPRLLPGSARSGSAA